MGRSLSRDCSVEPLVAGLDGFAISLSWPERLGTAELTKLLGRDHEGPPVSPRTQ